MIIFQSLISLLFIILSSFTLGTLFIKCFKNFDHVSINFKLAIGLGLTSYLIMFIGVLGLYIDTLFLSLLILLFSIAILFFKKLNKFSVKIIKFKFSEKIYLTLLLLILILAFFEVLAPVTTGDSLSYHFKIPYDYVKAQELIYVQSSLYNMPHLIQMLYVVPFLFGANDIGCHFINYYICLLFLSVLYEFSKCLFGRKVALVSLLIVSTLPMFTFIKVSGRVEVGLSLFIILGIFSIINFLKTKKIEWIILCGACLGISAGIKYTGLFYVTILGLILFIILLKNSCNEYKKNAVTFLVFTLAGLLFSFPFYLKSYLMTGNPIYPFLFSIFGGKDWSQSLAVMSNLHFDAFKKPGGDSFLDFLKLPWLLTMDGEKFIAGKNGYGFLFISFLPILLIYLFLSIKKSGINILFNLENRVNIISWVIILGFVMWFLFSFHRGRHLFIIYVLLSILISFLISGHFQIYQVLRNHRIYNFFINLLFVSSLIFGLFISILFNLNYAKVALGLEKKEVFLEKNKPQYKYFKKANNLFKESDKILNLFGHDQYYLKNKQFYPSPYFQGWIDWSKIKKVNNYYAKLKNNNFTYIIGYHFNDYKELNVNDYDKTINNIVMFNHLNYKLIKLHSELIFCDSYKEYNSRTVKTSFIKRTFCVYKII